MTARGFGMMVLQGVLIGFAGDLLFSRFLFRFVP